MVTPGDDEVEKIAPLVSVLPDGGKDTESIGVRITAQLNDVGALEVSLEATDGKLRWPLRFDLRPVAESTEPPPAAAPEKPAVIIDAERLAAATELIRDRFNSPADELRPLTRELEEALATTKADWPLHAVRAMADVFLELRDCCNRSPYHERRWFNLTGYCMRPGFGDVADKLRLQEFWKQWIVGPVYKRDNDVTAEWWVFWRRIVSGLNIGHQTTIGVELVKELFPSNAYAYYIRAGERARQEMWRCLGALELQPVHMKINAGNVMVNRDDDLRGFECWVLARLGARRPFHAPAHAVVPADIAAPWVERLMALDTERRNDRMHLFAIARIAAMTDDRNLDLPADLLTRAQDFLADRRCPRSWIDGLHNAVRLTTEDQAKILGDTLPLGLTLVDSDS